MTHHFRPSADPWNAPTLCDFVIRGKLPALKGWVPGRQRLVKLHVYHVSLRSIVSGLNMVLPRSVMGGAYHAGIEVDGLEWSFGSLEEPGETGVSECAPMMNAYHRYSECIELGPTALTAEQVTHSTPLRSSADPWTAPTVCDCAPGVNCPH